ncbi:MAG: hypothetical protein GY795_21845 [Desulfobacterales bacterium]|nr:hypothetical protein [Desulfobacterales bacterium]
MEESVFRQLMQLGFLLLQLWFVRHNQGNYGKATETAGAKPKEAERVRRRITQFSEN